VALAAFLLWMIATALTMQQTPPPADLEIAADVAFVVSSATACLGFAAVFLRFATGRSPVFETLSKNAYGIYLVHYLYVIWLQYLLRGVPMFAVAKAAVVFTGTLFLGWATAAAFGWIPTGARLTRAEQRILAKARKVSRA